MAAKTKTDELTSIEHGCFDTSALQEELAQALEDDRVYKLTDDMKKRAIHTAANYDEFKVSAESKAQNELKRSCTTALPHWY